MSLLLTAGGNPNEQNYMFRDKCTCFHLHAEQNLPGLARRSNEASPPTAAPCIENRDSRQRAPAHRSKGLPLRTVYTRCKCNSRAPGQMTSSTDSVRPTKAENGGKHEKTCGQKQRHGVKHENNNVPVPQVQYYCCCSPLSGEKTRHDSLPASSYTGDTDPLQTHMKFS